MNSELLEKVKNMPKVPGVYIYTDVHGEIIYVGKAKNLKNRVGSYFQNNLEKGTKTEALVSRINDVSYIEAQSEFEALILEAELIKKNRPHYNILLKDDKSYLYIVIKKEKPLLPKITVARKSDLNDSDQNFGPYPDGTTAKYIVRTIRKIFPYRDCSLAKYNRYHKLTKPCLYGHLGLCPAPCVNPDSTDVYKNNITQIKKLLSGDSIQILNQLKTKMKHASGEQNYEEAARYRDVLEKFDYIRQHFQTAQTYIDNPYFVEDLLSKALNEIAAAVPIIKTKLHRIECYDISNISGKDAVGSMTVAIEGRLTNSEYRKFKIKFKNEPDDYEMMREVLTRRVKHPDWPLPDLFVIDGGKGQVHAVLQVMTDLSIDVPVIGLAKRFETVVYKLGDEYLEINLDHSSEGLKLLQRLRDEAHRFGKQYHHLLRLKKLDTGKR